MLCFKVVLQLVFFFFKLAWASVTILGSNYARILYLFWLPKWLLYMLNCHRGVNNPDLPMSKIFIHFIVTLIQVLKGQTTGIFFQLIHHQKTSKSVTALIFWFGIKFIFSEKKWMSRGCVNISLLCYWFNNKQRSNHRKPKPILCTSLRITPKPI